MLDAHDSSLPSMEPLSVKDRASSRSIATLQTEAVSALAALHAAHVAAGAIWSNRLAKAQINQALGKGASADVIEEIAQIHRIWNQDGVALGLMLGQLSVIECSQKVITETVVAEDDEPELIQQILEDCQSELMKFQLQSAYEGAE